MKHFFFEKWFMMFRKAWVDWGYYLVKLYCAIHREKHFLPEISLEVGLDEKLTYRVQPYNVLKDLDVR